MVLPGVLSFLHACHKGNGIASAEVGVWEGGGREGGRGGREGGREGGGEGVRKERGREGEREGERTIFQIIGSYTISRLCTTHIHMHTHTHVHVDTFIYLLLEFPGHAPISDP